MNSWLNDTNLIAAGHATFDPTSDAPMSFPQQPQTINPAQFQNQPYLNGNTRTASPAFHQPMYQTNSLVPSKRSREDSLGTSPRQSHNVAPGSRSQTPGQGSYPGFNPQQTNGVPPFTSAPAQFQRLQTSNNATPSPTMQNMGFSAHNSSAQRVSTASPSPFSPQHNMTSASPAPSDQVNHVGTPHDMAQNFMANSAMNPNFNSQQMSQAMAAQMGMAQQMALSGHMPQATMNPAQRYQMQLQAQVQARQMQLQQQNRSANGMPVTPQTNMHQHGGQDQQNPMQPRPQNTPQDFFKGLQQFHAMKGSPLNTNPHICGRSVQAFQIYQAIFKQGGSVRITKEARWPMIAQMLQFTQQQAGQAADEIKQWWMANVGVYEQMWIQQQHKQRQAAQMQNQMSPSRDGVQNNHQRSQSDMAQLKINGQQSIPDRSGMNGLTPVKDPNDGLTNNHQRSSSRPLDTTELNGMQQQAQHEAQPKRLRSVSIKGEADQELTMPVRKPISDPFVPEIMPASRNHGPINVDEFFTIGQHVVELKPLVPSIRELGLIDIHALTMSIKSGMHGEMRNALDTLVTISSEPSLQLQLELCDDLIETLVDCAQVEVNFLTEHASEVSDEVSLSSYEEMVRACHAESRTLPKIPSFGSIDYDLDRAADRVICITTLIRNFSFYEPNFAMLGQPEVLQLMTKIIQHIGTRDLPLRSARNTLDFMKDTIIYLSNLSSSLHLPGKQDALCLLHFLLAFAPSPSPITPGSEKIAFAAYNPNIHKYLPPAVDTLAKLLARDEPNRIYFKSIFQADSRGAIPYELLTRTFGLVVAPIPPSSATMRAQVEARKPFLLQGLLAAEILTSLAPGAESPLARSWLQSEDCFAGNMLKMVSSLTTQPATTKQSRNPASQRSGVQDDDPLAHGSIVYRSMAVLKTLVNKSRIFDAEGNVSAAGVPGNALMKKELLLGVMIQKEVDGNTLRLLCQYAGLEE